MLGLVDNLSWYARVAREIVEFCHGRQVYMDIGGKLVEVQVKSTQDVMSSVSKHSGPVAFLATPTLNYDDSRLVTPTWLIGLRSRDYWRLGLYTAWLIVDFLAREGVSESVYLAYFGKGFEVRIHEKALLGINGKDYEEVAWKIVEYVLRKLKLKLQRIVYASKGNIYVGNGLDNHLLYAPLSLISSSEAVVYFKVDDVDEFEPSWANTNSIRYSSKWKQYREGEVLELYNKALKQVKDTKTTIIKVGKQISWREVDRFQVMGLLQAARYYLLTNDVEKAKSFGYNRAVFYAWAKHYGGRVRYYSSTRRTQSTIQATSTVEDRSWRQASVLGEPVTISPRGWYGMGGEEHLPKHYDENIARKIEVVLPYEIAWKAALNYLKRFPKEILVDQQKFFKYVYQPVRDNFIEEVVVKGMPTTTMKLDKAVKTSRRQVGETIFKKKHVSLEEFLKKK